MKNKITSFMKSFLKCGLAGWCLEILFTAVGSLRRRDLTLKGVTSVWMFPIYGCGAFLGLLGRFLKKLPVWFRGLTYMSMIFSAEYLSGSFLSRHRLCPWDYGRSRWNVNRVIRLDYAPCWFAAGLLFERMLSGRKAPGTPPERKNQQEKPC